jgi:hypothetical protein
MKRRLASVRRGFLLLTLSCLCASAAQARQANAPESPGADSPSPAAGATRKVDEYGKIGHCDETARLDNFAIELQNEPSAKGYLLVYVGKNDLPAWTDGILGRAAGYLVNSRGIDEGRLKVVNGGYREERTTELWFVPEHGDPPQPSNTVEHKLDRTKAYQWDEDAFNVEFEPDDTEPAEAEGADGADADEDAEKTGAPEDAAAEAAAAEEERWEKEAEKYQIEVVARGVFESEPEEPPAPGASGEGVAADDAAAAAEGVVEPEGPPPAGEIRVGLWWNVEKLADELKAVPDARLCLVYYWGVKNATQERAKELVEQAVVKTGQQLGLKRDRIVVIDGGRSYDPGIEIWVVPPGAEAPRPRPAEKRNFGFYTMAGEE